MAKAKITTADDLARILSKDPSDRNEDELAMLDESRSLIPNARALIKSRLARQALKQRAIEQEESIESIEEKVSILAKLIKESKYTIIYTGAGISTSASIPDYRGPNGLWTQIRKTGTFSITKLHDLTTAEPTFTHMALRELCRLRLINHVVSQNCDGLHLRSGIPQSQLSEIHGNMYIEVCPTCEKQYYRQADITTRTSRFRHKTGRKCHTCKEPNNNLIDTIVLYGERSRTKWPMNWERANRAARKADLIICMGSSLKTLRRYECLWPKRSTSSASKVTDPKLAIINLQYTSKDKKAVLKINGKCDNVMQLVMQKLNIDVPEYKWSADPLYHLAVPFTREERDVLKANLIFDSKINFSSGLEVSNEVRDPQHTLQTVSFRSQIDCDKTTSDALQFDQASTSNHDSKVEPKQETVNPVIPGWLIKSLGMNPKPSYCKRRRRSNK